MPNRETSSQGLHSNFLVADSSRSIGQACGQQPGRRETLIPSFRSQRCVSPQTFQAAMNKRSVTMPDGAGRQVFGTTAGSWVAQTATCLSKRPDAMHEEVTRGSWTWLSTASRQSRLAGQGPPGRKAGGGFCGVRGSLEVKGCGELGRDGAVDITAACQQSTPQWTVLEVMHDLSPGGDWMREDEQRKFSWWIAASNAGARAFVL